MKIVLLVDAACDLPSDFLAQRGIEVLPIAYFIDGKEYLDQKDAQKLGAFYNENLLTFEHEVDSRPLECEEVHKLIMKDLINSSEYLIIQTTSRKRSPIFEHCEKAQRLVQKSFREKKDAGELDGHFSMRVMNTATMFAGQGVMAAFTSDLISAGKSTKDVLRLVEAFKDKIYAYALPANVSYIRERARKRGEDSLGALSAFVAKSFDIKPIIQMKNGDTQPVAKERGFEKAANALFDYAIRRVEKGLLCPYLVISIASNKHDLLKYASFKSLIDVCKANKVELLTCVMGLAGGVNIGPGSISMSLASEEHEFSDS